MWFGWKGLRLFHDFKAASVSKTAAVRKSDLFSCVVCLLSHLITLYSEIKNHPPRPEAGTLLVSSLTGALGSMSLSSAPAGFVISGWVRADGDHLWNKDAEGRDREDPLFQNVWQAGTRLLETKNTFADLKKRRILWSYIDKEHSWGLVYIYAHYSMDTLSFYFCQSQGGMLKAEKATRYGPCPQDARGSDGREMR